VKKKKTVRYITDSQAAALQRPAKGTTLFEPIPLPRHIFGEREPFPDPAAEKLHPLDTLSQAEEISRVTDEMDKGLTDALAPSPDAGNFERMDWKGTRRELCEYMLELLNAGKIVAKNRDQLYRMIARHFTVEGKLLDHDSLRTSMAEKQGKELGQVRR
jgi:hypothetical protein